MFIVTEYAALMCRISVISMWLYCTVEKCVDPDQLASTQKPADLDLHFFFKTGPII